MYVNSRNKNTCCCYKRYNTELFKHGTATIHEAMNRLGAMEYSIKPIYNGMKLCGSAITVKCHTGDNIMLIRAIDVATKGDVVVCDAGELSETGGWGELTSIAAMAKGISGLVINAGVRDGEKIKELGFPVFAKMLCVKGTVKETPGTINRPVSVGGVIVNPGDLIVGDDDGVVVVPSREIEGVLARVCERSEKEKKIKERLSGGESLFDIMNYRRVFEEKGLKV